MEQEDKTITEKIATAHLTMDMMLYSGFPQPVPVRNISIGLVRCVKKDAGEYSFSGTTEDDYGKARIINGSLDKNEISFQLIYDTTVEDVPESVCVNLKASRLEKIIVGGFYGEFSYLQPNDQTPTTGMVTLALVFNK